MQLILFESEPESLPESSCGKTSPESSPTRRTPSDVYLRRLLGKAASCNLQGANGQTLVLCMDPREQSRGGFLMPNISEWPNGVAGCSLSQALEKDSTPERYFLTSEACAGILRRLSRKGVTPRFVSADAATRFQLALASCNAPSAGKL